MNGFIFRLERLFRFREQIERQRAQELAKAVRAEQHRRDALREASDRLEQMSGQTQGPGGIATAGALRNLGLTVQAAATRVEAAEQSHRDAERVVASEQAEYGAARRDRRVLERLRENRQDEFRVESSRAEQRELDERAAPRGSADREAA